MSEDNATIRVQVCYAQKDAIFLRDLEMQQGATLEQAIHASEVLAQVPGLTLAECKAGIFGKARPLDTVLRESDRVEIYRPLLADPKEARRRRALKKEKAR